MHHSLHPLLPANIQLYVDGEMYGEVAPGAGGFYRDAVTNKVAAASQWLKGNTMAPFDEMVRDKTPQN